MSEQLRQVTKESLDRLETVVAPTTENYMDVIRAISAMPTKKLQPLYAELYGHDPMVTVTRGEGEDATEETLLSPNRKQLVRLCQYGFQALFYTVVCDGDLPAPVAKVTEEAMCEPLVENSPRSGTKRVSRGPTIKSLVLKILAGTEQTYTNPETGEEVTGMVAPSNDDIIAAVKEKFPESKFDKTHLAWYLTQYRNGKFENVGYGGDTGKPLAMLTRDIDKAINKKKREEEKAEKAAKAAEKKAQAKEVEVPSEDAPDPLDEFDDEATTENVAADSDEVLDEDEEVAVE